MTRTRWTRSFPRFASAGIAAALAWACVHGEHARACGWEGPSITDETYFDPSVLGGDVSPGLYFDPYVRSYADDGEWGCTGCDPATNTKDWLAYLHDVGVTPVELDAIMHTMTVVDLDALAKRSKKAPKLAATATYLALAKTIEPYAQSGKEPPPALLATARAGEKATAKDPFLAQRYTFLEVRVLFYRQEYAAAVHVVDTKAALSGPSDDLKWRARWYLAGSLEHAGKRARANLELARIGADYGPLAGAAQTDFLPLEDADWQDALRLAKDPKDKAKLWRLAGIKHDGLTAIREIQKLDPVSPYLPLLVVRELSRAESTTAPKAITELEAVASTLASTPAIDRPWFWELVTGHLAALRGDVAKARPHLEHAIVLAPHMPAIANQAHASLAIALARSWRITPQNELEIATALTALPADFGRRDTVIREVRSSLATIYRASGKPVEAEFLAPDPLDPSEVSPRTRPNSIWTATFLRQMILRAQQPTTMFDRLLLQDSYTVGHLQQELALRYVLDGDYAGAVKVFADAKTDSAPIGVDPFIIHVDDCHDCDQAATAGAGWTHAKVAARMAVLAKTAAGTGEAAAKASLELGNGLYNITYWGNARSVLGSTHLTTMDTHAAERAYKRAFDLSTNRETKAEAAWLAAKCEVDRALNTDPDRIWDGPVDPQPATTWYPVVKRYAATAYVKEALAECGWYAKWAGTH